MTVKKVLLLLLCTGLLLAGCQPALPAPSQSPASSQKEPAPSAVPQETLAVRAAGLIQAGDPGCTRFDVILPYGQGVKVTPALMKDLGNLMTQGAKEQSTMPKSLSHDSEGGNIMITTSGGKTPGQDCVVVLDKGTAEYPENTAMTIHTGAENGFYLLDKGMFDQVQGLIDQAQYTYETVLRGEYVELKLDLEDGIPENLVPTQRGGVFFINRQRGYPRIRSVDFTTGEQLPLQSPWGENDGPTGSNPVLEPSVYEGYDCRMRTGSEIHYFSSQENGPKPVKFPLPQEVKQALHDPNRWKSTTFDMDPHHNLLAWQEKDGIHLGGMDGKGGKLVLPSAAIAQTEEFKDQKLEGLMDEPHLMNGGKTLVATVTFPGAQMSCSGLAVLNLESGKTTWYNKVFQVMDAQGLSYPDDQTILAGGYQIRLADGVAQELPPEEGTGWTVDHEAYAVVEKTLDQEGKALYTLKLDQPGVKTTPKTLLTATGERFFVVGMTQNHIICYYRDAKKSGLVAVKQP